MLANRRLEPQPQAGKIALCADCQHEPNHVIHLDPCLEFKEVVQNPPENWMKQQHLPEDLRSIYFEGFQITTLGKALIPYCQGFKKNPKFHHRTQVIVNGKSTDAWTWDISGAVCRLDKNGFGRGMFATKACSRGQAIALYEGIYTPETLKTILGNDGQADSFTKTNYLNDVLDARHLKDLHGNVIWNLELAVK